MTEKGRVFVSQAEHASFKHALRSILIAADRAERLRKSTPSLPINNSPLVAVHKMFILSNNSILHSKKNQPNKYASQEKNQPKGGWRSNCLEAVITKAIQWSHSWLYSALFSQILILP